MQAELPWVLFWVHNMAQKQYTLTAQELLMVVYAFEKFQAYLLGSKVIVYMDHAVIRYLMAKKRRSQG